MERSDIIIIWCLILFFAVFLAYMIIVEGPSNIAAMERCMEFYSRDTCHGLLY